MQKNNRELGSFYEDLAARYLQEKGLSILERNYRSKAGEIDLIAEDNGTVVFIEVKYRYTSSAGDAATAVTKHKQKIISKVAVYYLYCTFHSYSIPCRFDVVAINDEQISWYKNAFEYQGKAFI